MFFIDVLYRIYSKYLDNWEFFNAIKCINRIFKNILLMLIVTKIQQLVPFFNNNLSDNIIVSIIKIEYINN